MERRGTKARRKRREPAVKSVAGRERAAIEDVLFEKEPSPFSVRPQLHFRDGLVRAVLGEPPERIIEARRTVRAVRTAERSVNISPRAPNARKTQPEPTDAALVVDDETKTLLHRENLSASNGFEISAKLPVGHGALVLADFPVARPDVMIDERSAEDFARGCAGGKEFGGLGERARQRLGDFHRPPPAAAVGAGRGSTPPGC